MSYQSIHKQIGKQLSTRHHTIPAQIGNARSGKHLFINKRITRTGGSGFAEDVKGRTGQHLRGTAHLSQCFAAQQVAYRSGINGGTGPQRNTTMCTRCRTEKSKIIRYCRMQGYSGIVRLLICNSFHSVVPSCSRINTSSFDSPIMISAVVYTKLPSSRWPPMVRPVRSLTLICK